MFYRALRDLVDVKSEPPDVAAVLEALGPDPRGAARFWAAAAYLFGIPAPPQLPSPSLAGMQAVPRDVAKAEALLVEAMDSEEGLQECPDCAVLWGFGKLHGAFPPLRGGAAVSRLAEANALESPSAAYAAAAERGGSLGRLAWGQMRTRGVLAAQHGAGALEGLHWAFPAPGGGERAEHGEGARRGCLEALEAAMQVAAGAMMHEHTVVPQPVDLDFFRDLRSEQRHDYALATQLAADGEADGVAAKAEMLFYGRDRVVPQDTENRAPSGLPLPVFAAVAAAILAAAFALAPRLARRMWRGGAAASRCANGAAASVGPAGAAAARAAAAGTAADGGAAPGRGAVVATFFLRAAACAALALLWLYISPPAAPLGPLLADERAAAVLFEEAAALGHWGAAHTLAMIKLEGPNRSEATPWLLQVVEEGDDSARAFAGYLQHLWGLGTGRDPEMAGKLLRDAADLGDANAATILAEAYARAGGDNAEAQQPGRVLPPGGLSPSLALRYYRAAALAGRLTCRYNVGVLLMRQLDGPPAEMSLRKCSEVRAEFDAVATDLDPTVRLLYALAVRSWELGDADGALGIFMLLSEAGGEKAHRSAAALWQEHASGPLVVVAESPAAGGASDTGSDGGGVIGRAAAAEEVVAPPSAFHLVHQGRFCCPSGSCAEPGWLLNGGGYEPVACVQLCIELPACRFATIYVATGYCQLSAVCDASYEAGDATASTYELRATSPAPASASSAVPRSTWCWRLAETGRDAARRCAAAHHARMAGAVKPGAEVGSEADAEAAAMSAAGLMILLGLPSPASAWACHAATHFSSRAGRILCAELEAESWEGHPRNLSGSVRRLALLAGALVDGEFARAGADDGIGDGMESELADHAAAAAALALALAHFARAALARCTLEVWGVECPDFESTLSEWGAAGAFPLARLSLAGVPLASLPFERARFERWASLGASVVTVAVAALASALAAAATRRIRRAAW